MSQNPTHQDSHDRAGDRTELIARFQEPLRRYFRKRSYDPAEVEDLVQEVFCRLMAKDDPQRIDNPEAYVFQAAANLLRDRARRHRTWAAARDELSSQSQDSIEEISPERVLQGRQAVADLRRALMELPERTRVIFVLHRFEEIKYSEIAARLGISVSSVEKHMMDAIRHLATRVKRG